MSEPAYPLPPRVRSRVWSLIAVALVGQCGCAPGPAGGPRAAQGGSGSLFRPKGTPWTILCLELQGPSRVEQIERIAETLKHTPGIKAEEVFVEYDPDGFARLYHGVYYRRTDPKTGKRSISKRLRKDLELIKQLGTGQGEYYFMKAMISRLPMPDVGNPDWALSNAPGVYTLQVGVFEPTDVFWEYKRAAAQFCELLREEGYEAFYHHASASSMVTVGSFGPEAVQTSGDGRSVYTREVTDLQRQDELLRYNRLNGAIYKVKSDEGVMVPVPSRLVIIPKSEDAGPW